MGTEIFHLCYAAPISWYQKAVLHPKVYIEQHENFVKQSFRNRMEIASPNGKLLLIIPIQHGKNVHTLYKETKTISTERWQRQHWMSLETCYRTSPYFEFYEDMLRPLYTDNADNLFDFNLRMFDCISKMLKKHLEIQFTDSFIKTVETDYRTIITPKKDRKNGLEYRQVFDNKQGFMPDLSILDLIFNKGPEALEMLNKGYSK